MGWTSVGPKFPATAQTVPGTHPASYTVVTELFPGLKRPRRSVDNPPTFSEDFQERLELHLYSPSGPSCSILGRNFPLDYLKYILIVYMYTSINIKLKYSKLNSIVSKIILKY
jgi:hypothetical protein